MKRSLFMMLVFISFAVGATQGEDNNLSWSDPQVKRTLMQVKYSPAADAASSVFFQNDRERSFGLANTSAVRPDKVIKPDNESFPNIDLRYVDRDTMNTKKTVKIVKQGDDEDENGDGNKGDENGDDEDKKDEGKSGWDRIWDAPKLG